MSREHSSFVATSKAHAQLRPAIYAQFKHVGPRVVAVSVERGKFLAQTRHVEIGAEHFFFRACFREHARVRADNGAPTQLELASGQAFEQLTRGRIAAHAFEPRKHVLPPQHGSRSEYKASALKCIMARRKKISLTHGRDRPPFARPGSMLVHRGLHF